MSITLETFILHTVRAHVRPVVYRENGQDRLLSIAGDAVQGFDLNTGERLWSVCCQGEGVTASPVFADGHIYFLNEAGEATVIMAGPEFRVVARNPIGETCQASMAISAQRLIIRSDKSLFCIAKK